MNSARSLNGRRVRCALGENNASSRVRKPVTSRPTLSHAKSSARNQEPRLRQWSARHSIEGTTQYNTANVRDLSASAVELRMSGRRDIRADEVLARTMAAPEPDEGGHAGIDPEPWLNGLPAHSPGSGLLPRDPSPGPPRRPASWAAHSAAGTPSGS